MRNFKLTNEEETLIVMTLLNQLHEIESQEDYLITESDIHMIQSIKKLLRKFDIGV